VRYCGGHERDDLLVVPGLTGVDARALDRRWRRPGGFSWNQAQEIGS
jgi:hypothetical protein